MPLRELDGCSRRRAGRRPPRRRRAPARSCRGARRRERRDRSVSSTICFPVRRAAVNEFPISAWRRAAAVVPRLRNHASGACTCAISRSSAHAASTCRAASTSKISGTECELRVRDRAGLGALRELGVLGEEAARVARLGQLPVLLALARARPRRPAGRSCARRRRSRCGRRRRRTRSGRRRRLRARRARRRSPACRPRTGRRSRARRRRRGPAPFIAPVIASISRIPGPPFGPS